jgi:segregation and condensation protein B
LPLDTLGSQFAQVLGKGSDPYAAPEPAAGTATEQTPWETLLAAETRRESEAADDACEITPKSILEAMLFVGNPRNESLNPQRVASLMRGVRRTEIELLVQELNEQYAADGRPYLIESSGDGYRMALREEFRAVADKVSGRSRQARLSPAAIEVLAAVAYHQPMTGVEVTRLRDQPSGAILSQLVRRRLLKVERSTTGKAKELVYRTTERFLELFGLDSLEDLPRGDESEPR